MIPLNLEDRIFVAGASGMVGRAISKLLLESGYGNKKYGGALFMPSRNDLNLLSDNDVLDWFLVNKPSIVIDAAAKVGGIVANKTRPVDFLLQNLRIQNNIIHSAWKSGVRRLLFLGSSCIYPKHTSQPIKEEYLLTGPLEETNSSYAIAKIAGIKLCESFRSQYDFDAFSLMPTNLYGPGDSYHPSESHVLPSLIRRFYEACEDRAESVTCWGSGAPLREFLFVNDLAKACLFVLKNWHPDATNAPRKDDGSILSYLNVGTGVDFSIKELAERIASRLDFSGQIVWDTSQPDGTLKKRLDISRINKLGWLAETSFDDGLNASIADFIDSRASGNLRC